MAPGRRIESILQPGTVLDGQAPASARVDGGYARMSGTSFSAPQVSGAVALLLPGAARPHARPGQGAARLDGRARRRQPRRHARHRRRARRARFPRVRRRASRRRSSRPRPAQGDAPPAPQPVTPAPLVAAVPVPAAPTVKAVTPSVKNVNDPPCKNCVSALALEATADGPAGHVDGEHRRRRVGEGRRRLGEGARVVARRGGVGSRSRRLGSVPATFDKGSADRVKASDDWERAATIDGAPAWDDAARSQEAAASDLGKAQQLRQDRAGLGRRGRRLGGRRRRSGDRRRRGRAARQRGRSSRRRKQASVALNPSAGGWDTVAARGARPPPTRCSRATRPPLPRSTRRRLPPTTSRSSCYRSAGNTGKVSADSLSGGAGLRRRRPVLRAGGGLERRRRRVGQGAVDLEAVAQDADTAANTLQSKANPSPSAANYKKAAQAWIDAAAKWQSQAAAAQHSATSYDRAAGWNGSALAWAKASDAWSKNAGDWDKAEAAWLKARRPRQRGRRRNLGRPRAGLERRERRVAGRRVEQAPPAGTTRPRPSRPPRRTWEKAAGWNDAGSAWAKSASAYEKAAGWNDAAATWEKSAAAWDRAAGWNGAAGTAPRWNRAAGWNNAARRARQRGQHLVEPLQLDKSAADLDAAGTYWARAGEWEKAAFDWALSATRDPLADWNVPSTATDRVAVERERVGVAAASVSARPAGPARAGRRACGSPFRGLRGASVRATTRRCDTRRFRSACPRRALRLPAGQPRERDSSTSASRQVSASSSASSPRRASRSSRCAATSPTRCAGTRGSSRCCSAFVLLLQPLSVDVYGKGGISVSGVGLLTAGFVLGPGPRWSPRCSPRSSTPRSTGRSPTACSSTQPRLSLAAACGARRCSGSFPDDLDSGPVAVPASLAAGAVFTVVNLSLLSTAMSLVEAPFAALGLPRALPLARAPLPRLRAARTGRDARLRADRRRSASRRSSCRRR